VVLVVDRVDERVSRAHHLDRPISLTDEVPDDLDAVAAEVDDRAAAGQPAVPEPGAVRTGMRLARPDPGHVADRPALDRLDRLQRLRRVAQVLEVAREDARLFDCLEHPARFRRGPAGGPRNRPAFATVSSIRRASAAVRPRGFVQRTALPAAAANPTASSWREIRRAAQPD